MWVLWIILGLFLAFILCVVFALCVSGSRADDDAEKIGKRIEKDRETTREK